MAAYNAFLHPDPNTGGARFESGAAARYERYWQLYENTAYDQLSTYMAALPPQSKLYKYTRGLRNPIARYVSFYQSNTWSGALDMDAGDGSSVPSALPIDTENEALRPAIARVWQWSNWAQKRQVAVLHGTVTGDCFLVVTDRPKSGKVFMQVRWPGDFTTVEWDDFGNVKRAVIEYQASDGGQTYKYKEIIEHPAVHGQSQFTRFQTFKNDAPWAYLQNAPEAGEPSAEWEVPYDFVPVVQIPFMDVGMGLGQVGFAQAVRAIDEANATASLLNDQIKKAVNPPLVAYGVAQGDITLTTSDEAVPMLYVPRPPAEANIAQLVFDLNLDHALAILDSQMAQIHEDLPELKLSDALRSGMSGEALGQSFSDVISAIESRRGNFDAGLVRAQHMAVAIGGIRGYHADFASFGADSYANGTLDHNIGDRPVLPRSQNEELTAVKMQAEIMTMLTNAGADVYSAALAAGFSDEQAAAFLMGEVTSGITQ